MLRLSSICYVLYLDVAQAPRSFCGAVFIQKLQFCCRKIEGFNRSSCCLEGDRCGQKLHDGKYLLWMWSRIAPWKTNHYKVRNFSSLFVCLKVLVFLSLTLSNLHNICRELEDMGSKLCEVLLHLTDRGAGTGLMLFDSDEEDDRPNMWAHSYISSMISCFFPKVKRIRRTRVRFPVILTYSFLYPSDRYSSNGLTFYSSTFNNDRCYRKRKWSACIRPKEEGGCRIKLSDWSVSILNLCTKLPSNFASNSIFQFSVYPRIKASYHLLKNY